MLLELWENIFHHVTFYPMRHLKASISHACGGKPNCSHVVMIFIIWLVSYGLGRLTNFRKLLNGLYDEDRKWNPHKLNLNSCTSTVLGTGSWVIAPLWHFTPSQTADWHRFHEGYLGLAKCTLCHYNIHVCFHRVTMLRLGFTLDIICALIRHSYTSPQPVKMSQAQSPKNDVWEMSTKHLNMYIKYENRA